MLQCMQTKMATATTMDYLSDVDYMVMRARQYSKSDPHASKAWLITAKSLFPSSFVIQVRILTGMNVKSRGLQPSVIMNRVHVQDSFMFPLNTH